MTTEDTYRHRYVVDTERCDCGSEVTYFEDRPRFLGVEVYVPGYGCYTLSVPRWTCCEGTPELRHAATCPARAVGLSMRREVARDVADGLLSPDLCSWGDLADATDTTAYGDLDGSEWMDDENWHGIYEGAKWFVHDWLARGRVEIECD